MGTRRSSHPVASPGFRWANYAWALLEPSALNFFIRRDLRRAALFGWMMPFDAIRSSVRAASSTATSAEPWSPAVMASSAFLTSVRADDRNGRFRCRRRSETRIRFSADLLFAKSDHPQGDRPCRTAQRARHSDDCTQKAERWVGACGSLPEVGRWLQITSAGDQAVYKEKLRTADLWADGKVVQRSAVPVRKSGILRA